MEMGACAVLLIASILGENLLPLLNVCTMMGVEALVEVHTKKELDYAISIGASLFLVNRWDRLTGKFYPDQVRYALK